MKTKQRRSLNLIVGLLLCAVAALPARAATDYFGTANGSGSSYDLQGSYWTTSSSEAGTLSAYTSGNAIVIGKSAGDFNGETLTINLDLPGSTKLTSSGNNTITINSDNVSVTFIGTANNYFGVATTISVAAGSTLIWDVTHDGGFNFNNEATTFSGGGVNNFMTALGANAGTALITQTGGTMILSQTADGSFGQPAGGYTLTAGTLQFATGFALANAFSNFNGKTFTITSGSIDNTSGAAGVLNLGTGGYSIGGSFTFIGSSSLVLSNNSVALTASPTITVNNNTLTIGGVISGGGKSLTLAGSGTLALTNANTYTGGVNINGGVLNAGGPETPGTSGPLGVSGTITLGGGTLQYSSADNYDYSSRFSTAANQAYNIDVNGRNVTFAAALTSSGGSLTMSDSAGGGTLTLTGNNTYAGGTTINSGTLLANNSTSSTGSGPLTIYGNATLGGTGTIVSGTEVYGALSLVNGSINSLTFGSSLSIWGPTSMEINAATGAADQIVMTGGNEVYCEGTLNVVNLSGTLAADDTFQLISGPIAAGFYSVNLPQLPSGLVWDSSQLAPGGNGTISVIVYIPLAASAGTNQSTCPGSGVVIGGNPTASFGTGPYTYSWSPSTGLSSTTAANPTASPTSTTTYTVTVTDSLEAQAQSSMTVTVIPPATASAGLNQTICGGASTAGLGGVVGGGATGGIWTTSGSGTFSPNNQTLNATYNPSNADLPTNTQASTVTLTLTTTGTTCSATAQVVVTINPAESLTFLTFFPPSDFGNQNAVGGPSDGLMQANDGNFYGEAYEGGTYGSGYVFRLTPSGIYTPIYSFASNDIDGGDPNNTLVQGSDGYLYGMTCYYAGAVFRVSTNGDNFSVLHLFSPNSTDGQQPHGALIQSTTDGNFYGTTYKGGTTSQGGDSGSGTVFEINSTGSSYTVLYNFGAYPTDGILPSPLVQGNDGNFYGTTYLGGAAGATNGKGTVFQIIPGNPTVENILYSFAGSPNDGGYPTTPLLKGNDGNFYGTTSGDYVGYGTVFRITPGGNYTILYKFPSTSNDGVSPSSGLIQASDGYLYGETAAGGAYDTGDFGGIVYRIMPNGANYTILFNFGPNANDGSSSLMQPFGGLLQGCDGNLYGTCLDNGYYYGTPSFFKLAPCTSLPPTPAVSVNSATICAGNLAILTATTSASSPLSYLWNDPNASTTASITVSPASTTNYTVTVTDGAGCVNSSTGTVTVNSRPTSDVSGSATICNGGSATISVALTGAPPWDVTWGDGTNQIVTSSPATRTVSPSATKSYGVVALTDANCAASKDLGDFHGVALITVNPLPAVSVNSASFFMGSSATLTATTSASNASYLWSPGGETTASITVPDSSQDSGAGTWTYTVTVTDGTTGCVNSGSGVVTIAPVANWIPFAPGKWETPSNWSFGAPNITDTIFITNAGSKTITIDATTTASFANTLAVANLTLSSAVSSNLNLLFLTNAGTNIPLSVASNLTVLPGGALAMFNSALTVNNGVPPITLPNGSAVTFDGVVNITNSILNTSNALTTALGVNSSSNIGTLYMTNSTFTPYEFIVGEFAPASATLLNSVLNCGRQITVGLNASNGNGNTGSLTMSGGQITDTNTIFTPDDITATFGGSGAGTATFSNTLVNFGDTVVGSMGGSTGSLTVQNCAATIRKIYLGQGAEPSNSTQINATFLQQGGTVSLLETHIGMASNATCSVTLSNGTFTSPLVSVGEVAGASGGFNIDGGIANVDSLLNVGTNDPLASVSVTGGALYVTNSSHTAMTIVNGGMFIQSAGLFMTDNLQLTNGGAFETLSSLALGTIAGATNLLTLSGGSLIVSNAVLGLGNNGTTNNGLGACVAVVSNGTVNTGTLNLGSTAGGVGVLTLQTNAMVSIQSNLTLLSGSLNSTSSITINAGFLNASNSMTTVGSVGNAQMTINGGAVTLRQLILGSSNGAGTGSLSMYGGQLTILGPGTNGGPGIIPQRHILWVGGDLDSSGDLWIGEYGNSTVDTSGSFTGTLPNVLCGCTAGYTGSWVQSGGTVTVETNFVVGDCVPGGAVGAVTLTGGKLTVGTMIVHNGTLIIEPGATLIVNTLVVTDACALVINYGGPEALTYNNVIVAPTLDADGNGESNGDKENAGLDLFNPASVFEVTSVTQAPTGLQVTWTTEGGHNYLVQSSTSASSGFHDISQVISIGGSGPGTTNYIDTSANSNSTIFYRVHLGPPAP